MSEDDVERAGDRGDRDETPTERMDRNWDELLQELKVAQTGVQLQAGFLMTLPFQQRFTQLSAGQRDLYLVAFGFAILATALLVAPVPLHRVLFRRHRKGQLVDSASRLTGAGLISLALSLVAAVALIFDVTLGGAAGLAGAVGAAVVIGSLWLVHPVRLRNR
jgi:hypothetical protein